MNKRKVKPFCKKSFSKKGFQRRSWLECYRSVKDFYDHLVNQGLRKPRAKGYWKRYKNRLLLRKY